MSEKSREKPASNELWVSLGFVAALGALALGIDAL